VPRAFSAGGVALVVPEAGGATADHVHVPFTRSLGGVSRHTLLPPNQTMNVFDGG
jgi:hypothetical protein